MPRKKPLPKPSPKPKYRCRNKWCAEVTDDVYWKTATGKPVKDLPFCAACFEQAVRTMTRNLFNEPGYHHED